MWIAMCVCYVRACMRTESYLCQLLLQVRVGLLPLMELLPGLLERGLDNCHGRLETLKLVLFRCRGQLLLEGLQLRLKPAGKYKQTGHEVDHMRHSELLFRLGRNAQQKMDFFGKICNLQCVTDLSTFSCLGAAASSSSSCRILESRLH